MGEKADCKTYIRVFFSVWIACCGLPSRAGRTQDATHVTRTHVRGSVHRRRWVPARLLDLHTAPVRGKSRCSATASHARFPAHTHGFHPQEAACRGRERRGTLPVHEHP
jgi:hypothetical protein